MIELLLLILKISLMPVAVWRLYRLIARETGPKGLMRWLRVKAGVKYNKDFTDWSTKDGSFAAMITCHKCATLWMGGLMALLLLFTPNWVFFLVALPLNASGVSIIFEAIVWAPREYKQSVKEKQDKIISKPKNPFEPCF